MLADPPAANTGLVLLPVWVNRCQMRAESGGCMAGTSPWGLSVHQHGGVPTNAPLVTVVTSHHDAAVVQRCLCCGPAHTMGSGTGLQHIGF
jgi:hypothetical protein